MTTINYTSWHANEGRSLALYRKTVMLYTVLVISFTSIFFFANLTGGGGVGVGGGGVYGFFLSSVFDGVSNMSLEGERIPRN